MKTRAAQIWLILDNERVQEGQAYLIQNVVVGFNEPLNRFDFISFASVSESTVEEKIKLFTTSQFIFAKLYYFARF